MTPRYDKFTERARQVLNYAEEEARLLQYNYVGTEHLLLGLTRDQEDLGYQILVAFGADAEKIRSDINTLLARDSNTPDTPTPLALTPRTKRILTLAVDEARRLNHHYIGTGHLLLGLVREGEGRAATVLHQYGITLENVRVKIVELLTQAVGKSTQDTVHISSKTSVETLADYSLHYLQAIHVSALLRIADSLEDIAKSLKNKGDKSW